MKPTTSRYAAALAALLVATAWVDGVSAQSDPWGTRPPSSVTGSGMYGEDDPLDTHVQGGISLGIPLFLDVDRDVVRPGASLLFWGGIDIGYLLFALNFGFQWNPLDLDAIPGQSGFGRDPLRRIYFGPEIRFQIPLLKRWLPYIAAAFDANWFSFRETQIVCDIFYCNEISKYRFAPGFTAKVGTAIEIRNGVFIDFGLKWSLTAKGDFFQQSRYWFEPYIGVLVRRPSPWH